MKPTLMVVLLMPLVVNGCMMAGMAAMGGAGHMSGGGAHRSADAEPERPPSVIKEVTSGALRVTVEFPTSAPGDSLRYGATIQYRDGRAVTDDAAIFLEISPGTTGVAVVSPAQTHAGHPPKIAHAPSDGFERTRLTPVERGGGRYIFRPNIPADGAYRLAVVVERVGDTVLDPPVVVEHVAQGASIAPVPPIHGHSMWRGGLTPLALLGAGFMAVMMLVAIR